MQEHLSTFAAAASNYKQAAVLAKDADEEEEAAKLFAKVRNHVMYTYIYIVYNTAFCIRYEKPLFAKLRNPFGFSTTHVTCSLYFLTENVGVRSFSCTPACISIQPLLPLQTGCRVG